MQTLTHSGSTTGMNFWIEGKVRLYEEDYSSSTAILERLVKQQFPVVERYNNDYHTTLLYIGGPHQPDRIKQILKHSLISHLYFYSNELSLMAGGEDYDQLLLKFKSQDMVNVHNTVRQNFEYHGVKPQQTVYAGGFTPHVTLAKFEDRETCEAEIEQDNGLFVQMLKDSGGPLVVGDFHLFGSSESNDKVLIL